MAERSWNELVEEGRRLLDQEESALSDIKWKWGDLALEVDPIGPPGGGIRGSGVHEKLRRYAEEVGWLDMERSFDTLFLYRAVGAAWPPETRCEGATFSTHAELRSHPDRRDLIRPGLPRMEARKLAGRSVGRVRVPDTGTLEHVKVALTNPEVAKAVMEDPEVRHIVDESRPTEEKVEQARRILRDPTVARQIHRDPDVRPTLMRAAADVTREMEHESRERQRERAPELVNMSDFYEAAGEMNRSRRALMKALDAMRRVTLDEDQREGLKDDSRRARDVLDWIDSYLESGDRSFDDELTRLLSEET